MLATSYIGQYHAHKNLPGMFGGYTIIVQIYIFSSPVGSLCHIPGIVHCMSYIVCHQLCAMKPSILCHHIWLVPNYISMSVNGSPSNLIGIISGLSQPPCAWRLMSTNEIVKKWLCASQDIEIKNIYLVLLLGIKAFTQHLLFKYTMVGNFRILKST